MSDLRLYERPTKIVAQVELESGAVVSIPLADVTLSRHGNSFSELRIPLRPSLFRGFRDVFTDVAYKGI